MPVIRTCTQCNQKNRVAAGHLASTGRCGACKATLPPVAEPLAADPALFDEILNNAKVPVLVDFWAEWCRPCHMLAPTVAEIANDYTGKLKVMKLNVDEAMNSAGRYRVQGIPTLLLFKNGQVVEQIVGAVPKDQITKAVDRHLV